MIRFCLYIAYVMMIMRGVCISEERDVSQIAADIGMDTTISSETVIDSVAVRGIEPSLKEEIVSRILSVKGSTFNSGLVEHDTSAITDYLRERGWWKASVSTSFDSLAQIGVMLVFDAVIGTPARFGVIEYFATDTSPGMCDQDLSALYSDRFTRQKLDDSIDALINEYASLGYPGVTVIPLLSAHGDTVDVTLSVTAGKRSLIDSVAVTGLTKTKDNVVRREFEQFIGQFVEPELQREVQAVVSGMHYVREKNPAYIGYDPDGRGILFIALEEGSQGTFDGALGYQPSSGEGSSELVGKVDLSFANLFGTGRSSRVRWENAGTGTEDLEIKYVEPWMFGQPYNGAVAFLQEEREQQGFIRTSMTSSVGRNIGYLHGDIGFRYEKVSGDSLHSSSATGAEVGVSWTSLDNPRNPSSGLRVSGLWSMVMKKYRFESGKKNRLDRTELDLDQFLPTAPRQTAAILVRYRSVNAPLANLGPSDRYWLGGAATIRGYRERIIPALKAIWTSLEYRYLTGETSRAFVFADIGYTMNKIHSEGDILKNTKTVAGYGFGLRLSSPAGTLGFDYGLSAGDSPGEGKLHVRLTTDF